MSDTSTHRLNAIQTLAQLVVTGLSDEQLEPYAEHFATCMIMLGVDTGEIRDAMNFALITTGGDHD